MAISSRKNPSRLSALLKGKPTKYTLVGFMRTRGDGFWWTQTLLAAGLGVSRRPVGRWLQQLDRAVRPVSAAKRPSPPMATRPPIMSCTELCK